MRTERSGSAAERVAASRVRLDELRQLSRRLEAGENVDAADLALSRSRADEAWRHSRLAHLRAAAAYESAATRHLEVALAADRAGNAKLASRHRRAAAADESLAKLAQTGHEGTEADEVGA